MESVLGLGEPDTPEEQLEIAALDLGNIVHEALDRFVKEVLEDVENRPGAGRKWTKKHRARLQELGGAVCDEFEARGLTGRAVLWRRKRRTILRDLDMLLTKDDDRRLVSRLAPVAVRVGVRVLRGVTGARGLPRRRKDAALPRERRQGRRGSRRRSRRDRLQDRQRLRVRWHRQGRGPDGRRTKLQLPVYALAARREFGTDTTSVSAAYWFVTSKRSFRWIGYEVTDDDPRRVP